MKGFFAALPALAIALLATPALAQEPTEPLRYPPSSVRPKLILGGIAVTGIAYGSVYLAATQWPGTPGSSELLIPIAGPWLSLRRLGCSASEIAYTGRDPHAGPQFQVTATDCSGVLLFFRGFLAVIDGLAQLGGLGMIGEGIFMTTEADAPKKKAASSFTISPAPLLTPTSTGLGFIGRF